MIQQLPELWQDWETVRLIGRGSCTAPTSSALVAYRGGSSRTYPFTGGQISAN